MSNTSFSRRAVALLGAAAIVAIIVGLLLARSYLFSADRCNAELLLCSGEASSLTARADCYIELYHCRAFKEYRYPIADPSPGGPQHAAARRRRTSLLPSPQAAATTTGRDACATTRSPSSTSVGNTPT